MQRIKASMTQTDPRVICASVFDNGPVHLLSTVHTQGAEIITITRNRWDAEAKKVVPTPIERLLVRVLCVRRARGCCCEP